MDCDFSANTRVHIIGIGGAGMSGIARVLIERGCVVSGSDAHEAERLQSLRSVGALIHVGHNPDALGDMRPDVVLASTAIADTDPELNAALELGVRVMRRPEATGTLVKPWQVLAVSGTHGKTTTSSMAALMLRAADFDCSYLLGSELNATGVNAHQGTSPWAVVEADESDGTALLLGARAVAVTNVDADHLDRWGSFERLHSLFADFVSGSSGSAPEVAIVCADNAGAATLPVPANVQRLSYGFTPDADAQLDIVEEHPDGCEFVVRGALDLRARTRVPGRHNASNAVAAALLANHAGVNADAVVAGLADYTGARRRFELRGEVGGVRVFDDYAHHPTAVAATLQAAHSVSRGRVVVLCQPYRWYRTAMFVKEYADVLTNADWTVLVDVYGPGEDPIPGAGAADIAAAAQRTGAHVDYLPTKEQALALLCEKLRDGDLVLTLGGEDIRPAGAQLVTMLRERS
jgi:UDP-N-acetylmuramate--alanine ligase